jgi:hypothetical protein
MWLKGQARVKRKNNRIKMGNNLSYNLHRQSVAVVVDGKAVCLFEFSNAYSWMHGHKLKIMPAETFLPACRKHRQAY